MISNAPLRGERRKRGWSQKLLAELAGVSVKTIERAERGAPIRFDSIEQICACLEKKPEELGLIHQETLPLLREEKNTSHANASLILPISAFVNSYQNIDPSIESQNIGVMIRPSPIPDFGILARLEKAFAPRPRIDVATFEHLHLVVSELKRQLVQGKPTNWLGLLYTAINQLGLCVHLLESRIERSPELNVLIGETCLLVSDVSFNLRDFPTATRYYEMALRAAEEASDMALYAIAAGRYGLLLIDTKNLVQAEQLVSHALAVSYQSISSIVCSWLWAVKAEIHASKREAKQCYDALEAAKEQLSLNKERRQCYIFDTSLVSSVYGTTKLFGFEGACYLRLKQPKEAQRVLTASQKFSAHAHHQSLIHIDFARSLLQEGTPQEAAVFAIQALDYVQQSSSPRAFQRIMAIKQDLHRWHTLSEVKELSERIALLHEEGA